MAITPDDVKYVANLARLALTEDEVALFTEQLGGVIGYVEKIGELKIADVPPTAHAVQMVNVLREDSVKSSLSQEEALSNAPEREDGAFLVPKIIGEEP